MDKECGILWERSKELNDSEVEVALHKWASIVANKQRRTEVISWEHVPEDEADSLSRRLLEGRNAINFKDSAKALRCIRWIYILHSGHQLSGSQHNLPCKVGGGQLYHLEVADELW